MLVGVISDTHGVLPPAVFDAFAGVERIIHAGDVGRQAILDELAAIAPVIAVHGNMDTGELAWRLPTKAVVRLADQRIVVVHMAESLSGEPVEGVDIVITGHTHRASVDWIDGVLHLNPGAAGESSRAGAPPSVALLDLAVQPPSVRIVEL